MFANGAPKRSCAAKDCDVYHDPNETRRFRFPKDEVRCKLWVERSRNEDLLSIDSLTLNATKRLCGKHFARHAFRNELEQRLVHDAVPSIFHYTREGGENETEPLEWRPTTTPTAPRKRVQKSPTPPPTPPPHGKLGPLWNESHCPEQNAPKCIELESNIWEKHMQLYEQSEGREFLIVGEVCMIAEKDPNQMCGSVKCHDDLYSNIRAEKLVRCSSRCKKWFHLRCTDLTPEEYNVLSHKSSLRWHCEECCKDDIF